jgi:hypothetical protein
VSTAIVSFVQGIVDHPANRDRRPELVAVDLWRESILLVYRFLLVLHSKPGEVPTRHLVRPEVMPLLAFCAWDDRGQAGLLDALLYLRVGGRRQPIRHAELATEDLGRVYEFLLGLEPGLATEPMARLRRDRLELVVPAAQGQPYRNEGTRTKDRRLRLVWVEDIVPSAGSPGTFYLRSGLGRKTSGSYYTPSEFVRFLVRQTLGPQVEVLSPPDDPRPEALLGLTVLDPGMGSGIFLIEACRFLGAFLQEACQACAAREWGDRLPAEVAPYFHPNREIDLKTLRTICKRLVASRCLYGVDRDAIAVAVARTCLWLEVGCPGMSWAPLERHLVHGDSLTGPFLADLPHLVRPSAIEEPMPGRLGASQEAVEAFRLLALAWSGAVMLRGKPDIAAAYRELFAHVAEYNALPDPLPAAVARMIERARGDTGDGPPVSFDLTFPEAFYPGGLEGTRQGFHAVLCNPPWEALRPSEKEFFAVHDPAILEAPTARERRRRIAELLERPVVRVAWSAYRERFERQKACHDRLYRHQKVRIGNDLAGRYSDHYRVFAERAAELLRPGGRVGLVVPAAFHANAGATGIRRLYLEKMALQCCYSFENRRLVFPIDMRVKFALVVAARDGPTTEFPCAFYLRDPASLQEDPARLRYSLDFVRRTGGEYLTFLEARTSAELETLTRLVAGGRSLHSLETSHALVFRTEPCSFNVTKHGPLFSPAPDPSAEGYLPLVEGKCIHQFTDRWEKPPRYAVQVDAARRRPAALPNAGFYRLAFRTIAHATNERTAIFTVLPPGVVVSNSVAVEATPERRPNCVALWACAVLNTFAFDLTVRVRGGANMNLFIMRTGILPEAVPERFLAHAALRLVCNHAGFAPLWQEQLGEPRRGPWPVLATETARREVRAAVDAAVAVAYGLSREQYAQVLGTFPHTCQPSGPGWCLEKFDELTTTGMDAFCQRHDPYWHTPLNRTLAGSS